MKLVAWIDRHFYPTFSSNWDDKIFFVKGSSNILVATLLFWTLERVLELLKRCISKV